MKVGHHLLMLLIHTLLNTPKSLIEMLKLRSEAGLILIYVIFHRVEMSITDDCKLLYTSPERTDLSE